ncbi:MAG: acyl carrier protein [Streptococcaceae bacterium]|jgi:acyl carrier protein|nr:acyl carrier protein [Streptococcaceae bacterium]
MTQEEIYGKVTGLIANYFEVDPEKIDGETNITKDFGADSIQIMEFVLAMEDELEVEISDEEAENISTVNEIVAYLVKTVK